MGKIGDLLRRITGSGKDEKSPEPSRRDAGAGAGAAPAPTAVASPASPASSASPAPAASPVPGVSTAQDQPRHSIILRRSLLPVPEEHLARSFLGGLPRMRLDLEWPSA